MGVYYDYECSSSVVEGWGGGGDGGGGCSEYCGGGTPNTGYIIISSIGRQKRE